MNLFSRYNAVQSDIIVGTKQNKNVKGMKIQRSAVGWSSSSPAAMTNA